MLTLTIILLVIAIAGCICLLIMWSEERRIGRSSQSALDEIEETLGAKNLALTTECAMLRKQLERLSKWTAVADADSKAREITDAANLANEEARQTAARLVTQAMEEAAAIVAEAKRASRETGSDAKKKAETLLDQANTTLLAAHHRATDIVAIANRRADETAGKAMEAARNAEVFERIAKAMKNIVDGYGDQYLVPTNSLLDDLAAEFSHKQAGQMLKTSREVSMVMMRNGRAATCDYVEPNRREGAERFVVDAFNGKVDSILTRVKHDNSGTLEQEIRDAFQLVNLGGKPFRDARITEEYLNARLQELQWAATSQELKRQEMEEQRRIREQMREEERSRREFERAIRESAREEELIRTAMAKAEARVAAASDEQRAQLMTQLEELQSKLKEAEERNQRAISMAQQTKRGHVYVISNVGSFGENVYKIGLTRRLDPQDRVRELGDSSVPFEFDVHAFIMSDDAPALEHRLHKHFVLNQVNKVNHRKEFFRASLVEIRTEIENLGIEAHWTMAAEAAQFRESQAIERTIANDPKARDAWINRQLTLDIAAEMEPEVDDEFANTSD